MIARLVVPFRRWHYEWMSKEGRALEGGLDTTLTPGVLWQLEQQNSWTAVVDGSPIGCAGTVMHWPGRYMAWAWVSQAAYRHLPWATEEIAKRLQDVKGRIEFTVRADFPAGQRWAERLGFRVETPLLKAYGPEGEDHVGFVRIN